MNLAGAAVNSSGNLAQPPIDDLRLLPINLLRHPDVS